MEGVLGIFQSISATNPTDLNIYVKALEENQCLRFNITNATDPAIQHVTALLSRPSSRYEGLLLLQSFLKQCSLDIIGQKSILWATLCIKACNQKAEDSNILLAYDALSLLIQKSVEIPELLKSFSSTQICKICETFINVPPSSHLSALKCIETCLIFYPGACGGNSKTIIQRSLSNFIDYTDSNLVIWSAKCMHLLQQVRGGGVQGLSHKAAWQNYQNNLLGSLHQILNSLFANCTEIYDGDIENEPLNIKPLDLSTEPVQRASQLNIRFKNLLLYLIIAIREPFPVSKAFLPKKILNLITRGLSVNSTMLQNNPISDNIAIGVLLPDIHIQLFKLIETLILTLKSHLSMYYDEILSFATDTLKWTSFGKSNGFRKPYGNLRVAAYNMLSLWCKTMKYGSCFELCYENIVKEIFNDITPFQNELTLKVLSGAKKHISKKARRQLHKIQNDKSHLAQTHSKSFDSSTTKVIYSDHDNQSICMAALKCLNYAVLYCASFLKPILLKELQEKIIVIALQCNELCSIKQKTNLYSNYLCRQKLFNVLTTIVISPHHLCPPPTQLVIELLSLTQTHDLNPMVRNTCSNNLKILEKLLHPQKESLYFPTDLIEIKNQLKVQSLNSDVLNDDEDSLDFSNDGNGSEIEQTNRPLSSVNSMKINITPDRNIEKQRMIKEQNFDLPNEQIINTLEEIDNEKSLEKTIEIPKRNLHHIYEESDNSANTCLKRIRIDVDEVAELETFLIEESDDEMELIQKSSEETQIIQKSNILINKNDDIAKHLETVDENDDKSNNLDDDDIVSQFAAEFVNELHDS